ncbi:MAG TPA: PAS-domain containing protein [Burkholderiaceae bacterium]|nr:PAS-domain containing protein [Burkholderiaceae bacterium]
MPAIFSPKLEEIIAGVQQLPTGLSIIDRDLRLLFWNRALLELLDLPEMLMQEGVTLVEILRFNAQRGEYGPGDPEEQVSRRVEAALRFEAHDFERKRGDSRVLHISGRVLHDGDGVPWGFVTVYEDVTRERAFEHELQEKNTRLSAALAEVEQARLQLLQIASAGAGQGALEQIAEKLAAVQRLASG